MAKVFRIHKTGQSDIDWFNSSSIDPEMIDEIVVNDQRGTSFPTSIPSPFARMDLVRVAFQRVAKSNLEGNTDNHQLVSDALDIGQILFNYDKYKSELSVESWDVENSLSELLSSTNTKHQHLGKSLDLYLKQDSLQYNFDRIGKLFILKYQHKVIGGISPRTLFFASPAAKNIDVDIEFGNHKVLNNNKLPLFKRDDDYLQFLFALRKTNGFAEDFQEFNKYLDETLIKLDSYNHSLYNSINQLDGDSIDDYKDLSDPHTPSLKIKVLDRYYLRQKESSTDNISQTSDFIINATLPVTGDYPLVLPDGSFTEPLKYTTDIWSDQIQVPYKDPRPLNQRTLPQQNDVYPFLTIGDFLSDNVISLPYSIDSKKFYTSSDNDGRRYLIPLTKTFFKYFTSDDLISGNLISLTSLAGGGLEVHLKIPIKNNRFIEYRKIYYKGEASFGDQNKGRVIDLNFTVGVFPFVKSENTPVDYTIGFGDVKNSSALNLEFGYQNSSIQFKERTRSNKIDDMQPRLTKSFHFRNSFDIIWINTNGVYNAIIPKLNQYRPGGSKFSFAIDFGTTNTHIAYQLDGRRGSDSFNIDDSDVQFGLLRKPIKSELKDVQVGYISEIEGYLKQEILPLNIKPQSEYQTPFRTCLLENETINYNQETITFGDCNIGFDYEHKAILNYLKRQTNIKWAGVNDPNRHARVKHYIEELLILCKNKVLLNNGDIENVKITWFYPVSMQRARVNHLRAEWDKAFTNVFNMEPELHLFSIPESTAPFYFYKNFQNIPAATKPSVSIDIGGGTSDVVVFEDNTPKLISSFRFAGNSIFGDGFNGNIELNGFVSKYQKQFSHLLKENELIEEEKIFNDLLRKYRSSSDLISFLFSLDKNIHVSETGVSDRLNLSKMLSMDEDLKIIFLIFYTSLIYHIAQTLKAGGFAKPRNLLFSGTASKSLFILDNSKNFEITNVLFQAIIDEVFNRPGDSTKVKISITNEPKEITSKGGLTISNFNINISDLISVFIGDTADEKRLIKPLDTSNVKTSYADIAKGDVVNSVSNNIEEYYSLLEKLNSKLNLSEYVGISPFSFGVFKDVAKDDIEDYIIQGFNERKEEADDLDRSVEETLFFYPIIGLLYKLAFEIFDRKRIN